MGSAFGIFIPAGIVCAITLRKSLWWMYWVHIVLQVCLLEGSSLLYDMYVPFVWTAGQ